MTKIVAIIGGVLLFAGVALAGRVTALGSAGTPAIGSTLPPASSSVVYEATMRGHEAERRHERRHEARSARGERDAHGRHWRGHGREGARHGGHAEDD